jgi:RNA polymerase sigma factor (sigma-70 family)
MNIENHYRLHFTPVVTALCRHYPRVNADDILDAVQDAFVSAMQYQGTLSQPRAWLYRVSENQLLTVLKRRSRTVYLPIENDLTEEDNTYALLCLFCTLEGTERNRILLGLYFIGGLNTRQLASALKISIENVKKVLQRSRQMLRIAYTDFKPLPAYEPTARNLLYLLFNEGYKRTGGAEGINISLCFEALRLAQHLPPSSETYALLALMCYHASRFPARIKDGAFVPLYEQDRNLWDQNLIRQGHRYMQATGRSTHPYFLEALVSAQHCLAVDFKNTPWERIVLLYGKMRPYTEDVKLNHLIARGHLEVSSQIIQEIQELSPSFQHHMALAYLFERQNAYAEASTHYTKALERAENPCDKRFLQLKLEKLKGNMAEK